MGVDRVIGVDFGTSTSVVRVRRYEGARPLGDPQAVTFNMGSTVVPTLVREVRGDAYYGYDAQIERRGSVLHQGFKLDLESADGARREEARELTRRFLGYLAGVYREQSDGGHLGEASDAERTVVSYPVKWGEETKRFMVEAAGEVGFPNVEVCLVKSPFRKCASISLGCEHETF